MEEANDRLVELLYYMWDEDEELLQEIYDRHCLEFDEVEIEDLADEIRRDGSNSVFTLFRGGEGVDYDEIVRDVALAMDVDFGDEINEIKVENAIFGKLAESMAETEEGRKEIAEILGKSPSQLAKDGAIKKAIQGASYAAIRQIMIGFATRTGMKNAARIVGLTIPFLNILFAGWLAFDIAGPAFRKTIPTVIDIAIFRLEYLTNDGS